MKYLPIRKEGRGGWGERGFEGAYFVLLTVLWYVFHDVLFIFKGGGAHGKGRNVYWPVGGRPQTKPALAKTQKRTPPKHGKGEQRLHEDKEE